MKKLYDKNELSFTLAWIGIYCAASIPIRGNFGDESPLMLAVLLIIAAGITVFIKRYNLAEKYGLCKVRGRAADYLFFAPIIVLSTGNLWGGFGLAYSGVYQLFAVLSMLLIGYIEEMIFRGFLFRALLKRDSAPAAVTISAVTFGIGHIVNLLAGQGGIESAVQVLFAVAWGYMFTMVYYKSGSLWGCIIIHGVVDVFSKFAAEVTATPIAEYIYVIATIVIAIPYCLYLKSRPTALKKDE